MFLGSTKWYVQVSCTQFVLLPQIMEDVLLSLYHKFELKFELKFYIYSLALLNSTGKTKPEFVKQN